MKKLTTKEIYILLDRIRNNATLTEKGKIWEVNSWELPEFIELELKYE